MSLAIFDTIGILYPNIVPHKKLNFYVHIKGFLKYFKNPYKRLLHTYKFSICVILFISSSIFVSFFAESRTVWVAFSSFKLYI